MKRVFIIHGWGGSPREKIHEWLSNELRNRGIQTFVLEMPNTENPTIDSWISFLEDNVGICNEETFFFGHSIGCQTIMRYLERLADNEKAGGAVFLAGWFNLDNMESEEEEIIAKPWIDTKIDFDKIKKTCKNFEVIISDDEPYGFVEENFNSFKNNLNANITIEHNKGHFTEEEGITQIPLVLTKLLEMMKC